MIKCSKPEIENFENGTTSRGTLSPDSVGNDVLETMQNCSTKKHIRAVSLRSIV